MCAHERAHALVPTHLYTVLCEGIQAPLQAAEQQTVLCWLSLCLYGQPAFSFVSKTQSSIQMIQNPFFPWATGLQLVNQMCIWTQSKISHPFSWGLSLNWPPGGRDTLVLWRTTWCPTSLAGCFEAWMPQDMASNPALLGQLHISSTRLLVALGAGRGAGSCVTETQARQRPRGPCSHLLLQKSEV